MEQVKDEEDLIETIKDIANRFKQEDGHKELANILCGWVKRVGLKRLKIDITFAVNFVNKKELYQIKGDVYQCRL